ncbi:nuclease-related domain-containing protein [Acidiphilium acidophilum]|uniref:nuclease-related domain-containing protein n=1 Tax=Acidiphilium acidophilum TaxID=76588 RepID=UPI002E8E71C5|nr:nuclease-related domain-containing protein [Acidiphilium acidophilum]
MTTALVEIVCVFIAVASASLAVLMRPTEEAAEAQMQKAGAAGERRVARTLARAGIPAVHDVTIRDQQGTHQIDHIAAAGDALFVIETKTWRGDLRGYPDQPQWTLTKLGRPSASVYNPLMQNRTHADVIAAVAGMPVKSIVIMAGHAHMTGGLPGPMMPLASAVLRMTLAGPPSARAMSGLAAIDRIKQDVRQSVVAGQHIRRMSRRMPAESRRLWSVAGIATVAFAWLVLKLPI